MRIGTWRLLVKDGAVDRCAAFVNPQPSAEINATVIAAQQVHGVGRRRKYRKNHRVPGAGRSGVVHGQSGRARCGAYKDAFELATPNFDLSVSVVVVEIKSHDMSLCQKAEFVQGCQVQLDDVVDELLQR